MVQPNDIELCHQVYEAQSPSYTENPPAVLVRDARKCYGSKKNPLVILDGLNMTVPRGVIYGLLGASGCGKTTLLSCILGQRKLNGGQMWVLGGPPGSTSSGVPGPRVGYMPQETALYTDFTIHETFVYFGWIAGMKSEGIEERFEILTKLFMLPKTNQRVNTLSGGEQRRVSLAAVLLHQPELLILDEPTVGADPLLREKIWNHLLQICKEENTTVIITTHYIEEARQAQFVGLMRGGELLAEEPPEHLVSRFGAETLEDVFLKLSISQNQGHRQGSSQNTTNLPITSSVYNSRSGLVQGSVSDSLQMFNSLGKINVPNHLSALKADRMKALVWKNILWWIRNATTLVFSLLLAVSLISTVCLCIGGDPHDLTVAVVNYETDNNVHCGTTLSCNNSQLSCIYLEYLKRHSLILTYYNTEDEALNSVLHGKTYASVVIKQNYSDALRTRIYDWTNSEPWDIESSDIDIFRDVSNNPIASYLKIRLYDSFQNFIQEYLATCDLNTRAINIPIKWENPVYGVQYPIFLDFVIPGALLTLIFLLAVLLTACAMLIERNEASMERTFTMGITESELFTAHFVCEFVIMVLQSLAEILTAFTLFGATQNGSITLVILLTVLTGFCGMCYGLLISCFCDTFLSVNVLAVGSFFPTILLSGLVWPVESMHHYLKPLTAIFPLTKAAESLRNVIHKNWDFYEEGVYMGFVCVSIWTMVFLALSMITIRYKKF